MVQELDLEAVLQKLAASGQRTIAITTRINEEGRIVVKLGNDEGAPEFVVFGNNVRQYPIPKPPPQRAGVLGFDAFVGMGGR